MRDLGELWKSYQAKRDGNWDYETRVIIDGDIYYGSEIKSFSKSAGLVSDDFTIGTCQITRFDVSIIPHKDVVIPRNAEVELQMRIVDFEEDAALLDADSAILLDSIGNALYDTAFANNTDWVTFGTYYIVYRRIINNLLSLECYDAMIYANQDFFASHGTIDNYPMPASTMLNIISGIIGIPLDERNVIRGDVFVTQISTKSTMREILGFIAASHGGSFYITDENKLRLVTVKNDTPLFSITNGGMKRETTSNSRQFDKLYMVYSDNGDYYEAGTGETSLEVLNLFATRDITDRVYNQIKAYQYNTYDIQSADIDPALELGDNISINGVQCNLWNVVWTTRLFCDISAPTAGDIGQEIEFKGTQNNALRRQLSNYDDQFSLMELTLDNFFVEIGATYYTRQQIDGIITTTSVNLTSQFNVGINGLRYYVEENYSTSTETIGQIDQVANALIAVLYISPTEFNVRVGNSQNFSELKQTVDGFDFTGVVRFLPGNTYPSGSGGNITEIDGGNITAHSITANQIAVDVLQINNVLYGNYQVITCEGAYTSPYIRIGQNFPQAGRIVMQSMGVDFNCGSMFIGDYSNPVAMQIYSELFNISTESTFTLISEDGITLNANYGELRLSSWYYGISLNTNYDIRFNAQSMGFFGATPRSKQQLYLYGGTNPFAWGTTDLGANLMNLIYVFQGYGLLDIFYY